MIRHYPDIRQKRDHGCGDAEREAILQFFNVRARGAELSTETDGTHPSIMEESLRKAGLRVQAGTYDLADLKYHTKRGRPVLCPINVFGGHWVAVLGVTPKRLRYHCPIDGPQSVPHSAWLTLWHDSTRAGHCFDYWGIVAWQLS